MERKRSSKRKERKQKGITLVALVVTIVVLLILAGITIVYVFGDNGIFGQAQESKIATEQATLLEKMRTKVFEVQFEEVKQGKEVDEFNYLQANNYIDTDGIVNIATLFPQFSTGKGSQEQGDCYYVLDGKLYYTSNKKVEKYLGDLYEQTSIVPELKWIWHTEGDFAVISGLDISSLIKEEREYREIGTNYKMSGYNIDIGSSELRFPNEINGKKVKSVSLSDGYNGSASIHLEKIKKIIVPQNCSISGGTIKDDSWKSKTGVHLLNLEEIVCDSEFKGVATDYWGECSNGTCGCRKFSELN